MASRVDLHLHTTCSDGEFSPEELIVRASNLGLHTVAVADHDTVAGVAGAQRAARGRSLACISAVEISCDLAEGEAHFLGYFIDTAPDSPLMEMLSRFRDARLNRAHLILGKLAALGMPLEWEEVRRLAGGESVGRPHIAEAMLKHGYVQTVGEAFDCYLHKDGPAYVARFKLAPSDAIRLIHESGGVAVMAHPLDVVDLVGFFAQEGLDGLEAYYTGYSPDVSGQLVAVASRHGLIVTGGSDFHGPHVTPGVEIGSVDVPESVVPALHERHRVLKER
jgi:predicted metal-dependent phosphoesterase TrpH